MKIALAQLNYTINDFDGNIGKIKQAIKQAGNSGAQLVVFSELSVCGYPPRDLLEYETFLDRCSLAVKEIADHCHGIAAIVGAPSLNPNPKGKMLFNSAYVIQNGSITSIHEKSLLPDYDVFDEYRYFEPNTDNYALANINGIRAAITICEDLWDDQPVTSSVSRGRLYKHSPMEELVKHTPDLVINLSASPFSHDIEERRLAVFRSNVARFGLPVIYVNQVGGNTELLFDGGSMALNAKGEVIRQLKSFEEDFAIIDTEALNSSKSKLRPDNPDPDKGIARIHDALVMGIRDYFSKMGFSKATLGLSGGIDSAVVLALAREALGAESLRVLLLPSQYSSDHSITDALSLAENLNIRHDTINIQPIVETFTTRLNPIFGNLPEDITEENIQARIRGTLLMGLSNKFGHLLLNTTNKSEAAVGYGTLYGDMNGAIGVLGDVYKTEVYRLARYINRDREIIPENTILKAPSAELRPDQKDSDSLPPYEILDRILFHYIEQNLSIDKIVAKGFNPDVVNQVVTLVNRNEYKRFQSAPILRISSKAFGYGRRMPLVARW